MVGVWRRGRRVEDDVVLATADFVGEGGGGCDAQGVSCAPGGLFLEGGGSVELAGLKGG